MESKTKQAKPFDITKRRHPLPTLKEIEGMAATMTLDEVLGKMNSALDKFLLHKSSDYLELCGNWNKMLGIKIFLERQSIGETK